MKRNKIHFIYANGEAVMTREGGKIVDFSGDKAVIDIVKPMFEVALITEGGKSTTDEDGIAIFEEYQKIYEVGTIDFIRAVILERVFSSGIKVATYD